MKRTCSPIKPNTQKLTVFQPKQTPMQRKVTLGLLAMAIQSNKMQNAMDDLNIQFNCELPYSPINMAIDLLRIPDEWSETVKGKKEEFCSEWIYAALLEFQGTPEAFLEFLEAKNTVWIAD